MAVQLTACILTIGDELLIGQVVNTNVAWLGEQLTAAGVKVLRHVTVGDQLDAITSTFQSIVNQYDLVISTGGLGPTHDDITKQACFQVFGGEWIRLEPQLDLIRKLFEKRGREVTPVNIQQADILSTSTGLVNEKGTAPGMQFDTESSTVFICPGVPVEMKYLAETYILPWIAAQKTGIVTQQRILMTTGIPESTLSDKIGDVSAFLSESSSLAFLPSISGVRLRIMASGSDEATVSSVIDKIENHILAVAGQYVYGFDSESLEEIILRKCKEKGQTLAIAESCTGGLIGDRMTDVAGSSLVFLSDAVTYSNDSKVTLLGVKSETLSKAGAVSEEVAIEMAEGVRLFNQSTYGLSTTGIAGPDGGSDEKPVGLVYIGISGPNGSFAKRMVFPGDRRMVKERAAAAALNLLLKTIA